MTIYASLFRGINVGGKHKVKMDALRALHDSLRLGGAKSLLQSGNIVFATGETDPAALADRIAEAFETAFGFRSEVIVRTLAEIEQAIERNPFAGKPDIHPSRLLVTFLGGKPDGLGLIRLVPYATRAEEFQLVGRELYLHYPNGSGVSKLTLPVIERHLGTTGTARNLNTVTALASLGATLASR